jgi:glycogen(starch) synthase
LIIIGPDPLSYWEKLESQIRELKIENNIQYKGSVNDQEYLKLLSNFDVAVYPIQQRITASLLGALEAQALGIPVLSTGLGGVKEVVSDGRTGIICPTDPEAIYEGILKIYNGYKEDTWNRKEIRRWALEFSWEKIAERISGDLQQSMESNV